MTARLVVLAFGVLSTQFSGMGHPFALGHLASATAPGLLSVPVSARSKVRRVDRPIQDRYIVMLKENEALAGPLDVDAEADFIAQRFGVQIGHRWKHAFAGFAVKMTAAQAAALAEDPGIALVEEDGVVTLSGTESNAPWGLDRIDKRDRPLNGTYSYNVTGAGVTVYVVDSGVLATHNEFQGRVLGGYNSTDGGTNTDDCVGHGSNVAGIIGGATVGVAKGVTIVPIRVTSDCAGTTSATYLVSALNWILAHHAQTAVVNLSLEGPASVAVDTAVINTINAGMTVVAAAGDFGVDACSESPGRVPDAITVAGIGNADGDPRGTGWPGGHSSNFGTCVDMWAPGTRILGASSVNNVDLIPYSGTSQATGFVSGAAALYLSSDPQALPAKVARALATSASVNKVSDAQPGTPNLLLYTHGVAAACGPGYTSCAGDCRANFGGSSCATDCDCGATTSSYCYLGPSQCVSTTLAQPSFNLQQVVHFTGNGGSWTYLNQVPAVTIAPGNTRDVDFRFACWYPSSAPSSMGLDLRVMIDGAEAGIANETVGYSSSTCHVVARNVASGSHSVYFMVRTRLYSGPPSDVTVWAAQYSSGPTTLFANVLRVP